MPLIDAPPAPDLDTIFDVEGHTEPYFQRGLIAAGVVEADPARGVALQATPRVELQLHLGACVARNYHPPGSTDPRECLPSAWACTLIGTVVTDRAKPAQAGAHGRFRARYRRLAAQFFRQLNPLLPYHQFEKLIEAGTTPGLVNEEARTEDVSRIMHTGVVSVRATAWPRG